MRFRIIMGMMFLLTSTIFAQQSDILEKYIETGLENNLALKQKEFVLQKSLKALAEARGMFLPSINIDARYSRAGGGRMIDIPVGDLMNPLYSQLNDLLVSMGQPPQFPTNLQNEQVPFLRKEEHETKLRIIQPLFQPAIYHHYQLKSNLSKVQQAEMVIFKRQLIADIKSSYFNYLKAVSVVELLVKTQDLLDENLRVSEKLFQNGKATEEVVFRAKAEISELEQQKAEAEKNKKLAGSYINFLLNQPLENHIEIIDESGLVIQNVIALEQAQQFALENREEFKQMKSAIDASKNGIRISTSSYLPGITGVFDYGFQGEKYNFTEKDDYWMGSLLLNWNLFQGFQDYSKRSQAVLEKRKLETQLAELEKQIKLQVQESYDNLTVAKKSIISANERLNSTKKSFNIINKKYQQGMTPQIEYLNARTSLTNAEINYIIARYDYFIKLAEFERVVAISN